MLELEFPRSTFSLLDRVSISTSSSRRGCGEVERPRADMAGDGQRRVRHRSDLHRESMIPRRFLSSTTGWFKSPVTATAKDATRRTLRPRYLFAGLVVWTGVGAYYLFPPSKNPLYSVTAGSPSGDDTPTTLVPTKWSPVSLIASEETSKDTRLLTLSIPRHLIPNSSTTRPIWSIYIKDDDIQVERPYTPLEGIDEDGNIKLWVKKYPKGEVGRWLHSKKPGENIEIRGPLQTWLHERHPDEWDEIIMVRSGGVFADCGLPDPTRVDLRWDRHNTFLSTRSRRTY